jgi:hypothetical protein
VLRQPIPSSYISNVSSGSSGSNGSGSGLSPLIASPTVTATPSPPVGAVVYRPGHSVNSSFGSLSPGSHPRNSDGRPAPPPPPRASTSSTTQTMASLLVPRTGTHASTPSNGVDDIAWDNSSHATASAIELHALPHPPPRASGGASIASVTIPLPAPPRTTPALATDNHDNDDTNEAAVAAPPVRTTTVSSKSSSSRALPLPPPPPRASNVRTGLPPAGRPQVQSNDDE